MSKNEIIINEIDNDKKSDCFAYSNNKCNILTVKSCEGSSCKFYKTQVQVEKSRQKTSHRIKSLDKQTRNNIIDIYYGGNKKLLGDERL